jgi:hypothetical protein
MTTYRTHALMMRIPYGLHRRTRASRPVWVPESRPGPRPGIRTWAAIARDVLFGLLLILTLVACVSGWKRPGTDDPDTRLAALIRDLKADEPAVKRAAAERLAEMGPAAGAAVPALTEALNDSEVCHGALQALKKIQSRSAN